MERTASQVGARDPVLGTVATAERSTLREPRSSIWRTYRARAGTGSSAHLSWYRFGSCGRNLWRRALVSKDRYRSGRKSDQSLEHDDHDYREPDRPAGAEPNSVE